MSFQSTSRPSKSLCLRVSVQSISVIRTESSLLITSNSSRPLIMVALSLSAIYLRPIASKTNKVHLKIMLTILTLISKFRTFRIHRTNNRTSKPCPRPACEGPSRRSTRLCPPQRGKLWSRLPHICWISFQGHLVSSLFKRKQNNQMWKEMKSRSKLHRSQENSWIMITRSTGVCCPSTEARMMWILLSSLHLGLLWKSKEHMRFNWIIGTTQKLSK